MSSRRCCCQEGGGCFCFCLDLNMKHLQTCKLECEIVNCQLDAQDCPGGSIDSFGVVNTMTPQLGELGPQEFVVWTQGATVCDCYECKGVYTYTPESTDFRRQVCFRLGDGGFPTVPLDSKTGGVQITATAAPACPAGCGCCGPNRYWITIILQDQLPAATVEGPCGNATYVAEYGLVNVAWRTTYTLRYCWDSSNPCELTLAYIEVNSAEPPNSFGPDAFTYGGCDCGNNVEDLCEHSYTLGGCAPFTGDLATVYALAGSPPMTLDCQECPCESEMAE